MFQTFQIVSAILEHEQGKFCFESLKFPREIHMAWMGMFIIVCIFNYLAMIDEFVFRVVQFFTSIAVFLFPFRF